MIDPDYPRDGWIERRGVDLFLDNLASLMTALGQRRMSQEQLERYAALLSIGCQDAHRRTYTVAVRNERTDPLISGPGVGAHSTDDRDRLLHGE